MSDWHEQARALRRDGLSANAIAKIVGHTRTAVAYVLNENNDREKHRVKVLAQQKRNYIGQKCTVIFERHKSRAPRKIINHDPSAYQDFAKGLIDREELMRRISVGVAS